MLTVKKKKKIAENNSQNLEEIAISQSEFNLILKLATSVEDDEYILEIAGTDGTPDEPDIKSSRKAGEPKIKKLVIESEKTQDTNDSDSDNDIFAFTQEKTGFRNTKNYSLDNTEHAQRKWKNEDRIGLLLINNVFDYHSVAVLISTWKEFLAPDAKVAVFGSDKPGPVKAVKEAISDGGNFKIHKTLEKLMVLTSDKCVHHWLIDSNEVGTCKFCNRKRNFRKLMKLASSRRVSRKKKTGR